MIVDLPPFIWRSVRSVLHYGMERLERKAARSQSETSRKYDEERVSNLSDAIDAIDARLAEHFGDDDA